MHGTFCCSGYYMQFTLALPLYNIDSGGSWSDWSSWSSCSQTCNGGRRSRTRSCEDGADCEGSNIDIEQCNTQACASEWLEICRLPHLILQTQLSIAIHVHCQFNHIIHCTWAINPCTVNMYVVGTHKSLLCRHMALYTRLLFPSGYILMNDKILCTLQTAILAHFVLYVAEATWGQWTSWSKCTASCGGGRRTRKRKCEGGNTCIGQKTEYTDCNTHVCTEREL